jgi:DNA-binding NarL/FixJ family response regulator
LAIIIVDDLASGRKFHRLGIQGQGNWPDSAFIECGTLDEGIEAARTNAVEFVVLDLHLRGGKEQGADTLRRFLRETNVSPTKIFVCTADSDDIDLVDACYALGVKEVSDSGQPPWAAPPQVFTVGQVDELDKRITASVKRILREELSVIQKEQIERDKLKQAEGVMAAFKIVAGALVGALLAWLSSNPVYPTLKWAASSMLSLFTGNKAQ